MNIYLISYDLSGPETSENYLKLISEIKKYGYRANPLESFWLVATYDSIDSVINKLNSYLDHNDKLVVMNVSKDLWYAINLPKDVSDWMKIYI